MKILAPSYVFPNIRHIRTIMFKNIFSSLKNKTELDVTWVIFQPDKFSSTNHHDASLLDIHGFDHAVSLLKNVNPDGILITSTPDIIQYTMCIAAKYLNIPIFSIYVYSKFLVGSKSHQPIHKSIRRLFGKLSANKVSTDSLSQYKFLRRLKFIMYKIKFSFNTLHNIKINFIGSLMTVSKNILADMVDRTRNYNDMADYHFLPDDSWSEFLVKNGIDRESLFITGNPYWENLVCVDNSVQKKSDLQNSVNLLIVTDSLREHNYWSEKQMNEFIQNLILKLQQNTNLNFSFKIHPSSEDKQYYSKLFQNYPKPIQIFQSENLFDIITNFDLVISYGSTTAHTETIASNMKLILIDLGMDLELAPLVKEGISCGLVTMCKSVDNIEKIIYDCLDKNVVISNNLMEKRAALFSKNNESSEQIADIMIEKLSK
ncbi:MAG: hypothetical protein D9C04_01945 [Nitrosopumilus sp. B06]|nr:MAG: hypothetical protein D9C04_01945 [Nitrosopumilus sp. B06]